MEPFDAQPRLPADLDPELRLEGVTFGYSEDNQILSNIEFKAVPGTLSLIFGPSGVGKSTFGRIAAGIDRPAKGHVFLGGYDIAKHEPHDVRSKIAYIPQEPYLFSGTLRENLLIGHDSASDAEINDALCIAAADQLVDQMPQGLDTDIGERGSALSGGQRQRIAIARSLLKQPKVIIMDEPTSALDDAAQRRMAAELERIKEFTTLVIITHRPEIFEAPDQVIDFEKLI